MCWLSFCNWLHSRKTPSMHFVLCNLQSNLVLVLVEVKCPYITVFSGHHHLKIFGKIMKWHFWNIGGHPSTNNIEVGMKTSNWFLYSHIIFFLLLLPQLNALLSQHMAYWSFSHIYTHYMVSPPIIWDDDQLLIGRLRQLRL